jgi:hypothetical protein
MTHRDIQSAARGQSAEENEKYFVSGAAKPRPVGFRRSPAGRYVIGIALPGKPWPDPKELTLNADMTSVADAPGRLRQCFSPECESSADEHQ